MSKAAEFISVDTNILIKLLALQQNDTKVIAEMKDVGELDSITDLNTLINARRIKPVITPVVLSEIIQGIEYHGTDLVDFVRDSNVYVLDIDDKHRRKFFEQSENLAAKYCRSLTRADVFPILKNPHVKAKKCPQHLFHVEYNSKMGKVLPNNDARVMAQTTVSGLSLITNDFKDFIADNRPLLIGEFNNKYKYKDECLPYSSAMFIKRYLANTRFPTLETNLRGCVKRSDKVDFERVIR